jgi:hypothetical protein
MKIYSKVKPEKLLHIVYPLMISNNSNSREDIIPETEFLQLSALDLKEGKTFKPHKHVWRDSPTESIIAQESWVVISGSVEVTYYDIDDKILNKFTLFPGDVSITLAGGHNYLALENSFVYEFKTGPYEGQKKDKVFI